MELLPCIAGNPDRHGHRGGGGHDYCQQIRQVWTPHGPALAKGFGWEHRFGRIQDDPPILLCYTAFTHLIRFKGAGTEVSDTVSVDAKRILLRYGAPIAILDKVSDEHRVEFARIITRTTLADREPRLRELLAEKGYVDEE